MIRQSTQSKSRWAPRVSPAFFCLKTLAFKGFSALIGHRKADHTMSQNLPPIPFSDLERMAVAVAKSNLFGIKTPDQALTLMLISQAEGRPAALAARDYDIIQGRPAKKSEAMLRDFLESSGKVQWHELTDQAADATFSHPSGGEIRIRWDLKRAQNAGIGGKDMWKKYPRQMLRARVVSEGIRTVCPMATSGMYVPEEVKDFDDKEPVSPAKAPRDVSEPQPTPELSPAQIKRLYAIATASGRAHEDVKTMIHNKWGLASSTQLTKAQYDEICAYMEANSAAPALAVVEPASDKPEDWVVPFGTKYRGKRLGEIPMDELASYAEFLRAAAAKKNQHLDGPAKEFCERVELMQLECENPPSDFAPSDENVPF